MSSKHPELISNYRNFPRLENMTGKTGTGFYPYSWLRGTIGESAYEIALKNGFKGTEKEWLQSLFPQIGENGNWVIGGIDTGISADGSDIEMIALTKEEILEICK